MTKAIGFVVFISSIIIVSLTGWILNIYKLLSEAGPIAEFGALEVLRFVGIFFAPLGAVLGFI